MQHAPLVEVTRGDDVECIHYGSVAVVNPRGELLYRGSADRPPLLLALPAAFFERTAIGGCGVRFELRKALPQDS